MKDNKHFKKTKTLVQFSDGSSSFVFSYINKKEFSLELDIKSNPLWRNITNVSSASNTEERSIYFKKKYKK